MTPPLDKETEQLERLERIAQNSENPRLIRIQAEDPEEGIRYERNPKDVRWLVGFALAVACLYGLQALLYYQFARFDPLTVSRLAHYLQGGTIILMILTATKAVDIFLIGRVANRASRFTLRRIFRLLVALAIVFVAISVLFADWYTAVVSLGLISLVLGFALQMPISSFIAWIYILVRSPYRVGDRIKIGEAHGDVIDVSYLDTTLWEFGGEDLWTNHPSGRVIKFPNATVFSSPVFNYSWPLFPYVWNEIKLPLAFESDLDFVAQTMKDVVESDLGESMRERVRIYRSLLSTTPVDELEVKEHPVVHFRVNDATWLEAIVRYLVHPKQSGRVKTRLVKTLLRRLNDEPDRARFPKGDAR